MQVMVTGLVRLMALDPLPPLVVLLARWQRLSKARLQQQPNWRSVHRRGYKRRGQWPAFATEQDIMERMGGGSSTGGGAGVGPPLFFASPFGGGRVGGRRQGGEGKPAPSSGR
jgi:hypothetical protein